MDVCQRANSVVLIAVLVVDSAVRRARVSRMTGRLTTNPDRTRIQTSCRTAWQPLCSAAQNYLDIRK
jgi:hypothetical protein